MFTIEYPSREELARRLCGGRCDIKKMQNKPNLNHRHTTYAIRDHLCKTNPIPNHQHIHSYTHSPVYPKMQNKPNFKTYMLQGIDETRKRWRFYPHLFHKNKQLFLRNTQKTRTFLHFSQLLDPNTLNSMYNKDLQKYFHKKRDQQQNNAGYAALNHRHTKQTLNTNSIYLNILTIRT